jgi:hypothetical protein
MLGSRGNRHLWRASLAAMVVLTGASLTCPRAAAQELPTDPADALAAALAILDQLVPDDLPDPLAALDPLNPACDPLDPAMCLFPFPSDAWTTADPSTATGRRVDLPLLAMPRNIYGKPIDPTEWNRNDGFSPGSALLTFVPGLDLVRTWGLGDRPERYQDQVTDLALSLAPDAPIVLLDAATGERHPFFSELDGHGATPAAKRTLIIRPAVNLREGHRYVVALRGLLDAAGHPIAAGPAFAALRDGQAGGDRQRRYDEGIFPVLAAAGVARDDLYLAWDLTIASGRNLAGRVLAMRDQTFAALGDTDLADGVVQGAPPGFTIDSVEPSADPASDTARVVRGTIVVPNYLTLPAEAVVDVPEIGTFPVPGARFAYDSLRPGPDATPVVNPLFPRRSVPFVCAVPRSAVGGRPATPMLYGHGLLGSRGEALGGSTAGLRRAGYMPCAVDWTGMATGDLPNVALILQDASLMPSLVDRAQQGFLEFLVLGRALAHPAGLAGAAAFQGDDGRPLFDPAGLVYDGNSQGGIMGGALTALGVDFRRSVLGVPGMNYSTLLNRSVDWEGRYGQLAYAFYPSKMGQQLLFGLLQMLWDRGEADGYAQHMTADPLPGTPPHQVLLQAGFGDHQVANLAAEVEARTIGARRIPTDLPVCRHWARDPMFGFEAVDSDEATPAALAYFDSGTPTPPSDNDAPTGLGEDPHEHPRRDPGALRQATTFFRTGRVVDVADGGHARTDRWPDGAGPYLDQVLAQLDGRCLDPDEGERPTTVAGVQVAAGPSAAGGAPSRLPATGGGPAPAPAAALAGAGLLLALGCRALPRPGATGATARARGRARRRAR